MTNHNLSSEPLSPNMDRLLTPGQVRDLFVDSGTAISDWAREHGYSVKLTQLIVAGKRKCLRGQSHHIAVALGMKAGKRETI